MSNFSCWEKIFDYTTFPPDSSPIPVGKQLMINSNVELMKYLLCIDDYPVIDFSQHTLVVATDFTASTMSGIYDIVFLKYSSYQYVLRAKINEGIQGHCNFWCLSILTPKIPDESIIIFKRIKLK